MGACDLNVSVLTLLHGRFSGVQTDASIHRGWLARSVFVDTGARPKGLIRLTPSVIAITFVITFGLALVIYPSVRVDIRATWWDNQMPGGTTLSEIKAHALSVTGLLRTYRVPMSRRAMGCLGHVDTGSAPLGSSLISDALIVGPFVSTLGAP